MIIIPDRETVFPYEYVGGGYFRRKGVPVGTAASQEYESGLLHGMQVVDYLLRRLREETAIDKSAE